MTSGKFIQIPNGPKVASLGFGTMGLTWRDTVTPDEQAFEVLKYAADTGITYWNGGEFYGYSEDGNSLNLELIGRFFQKYPEYKDKIFLSVKGGDKSLVPNGTRDAVRKSVEGCIKSLGGKRMDLYQCARVDPNVPIQDTMSYLKELMDEGKITHVGLSEVNGETVKKANKIVPISAVELEVSLLSTHIFKDGTYAACRELNIPIIGYSPLARGALTGETKLKGFANVLPMFQGDNLEHNMGIVKAYGSIAEKKGVSLPAMAISWVMSHDGILALPGATTLKRWKETAVGYEISLSPEELKEIEQVGQSQAVRGERYPKDHLKYLSQ